MDAYRAVVVGATGAVGSALVRELLASDLCTGVTTIGRRTSGALPGTTDLAKLTQHVVDVSDIETRAASLAIGHRVAFCTLGIGQPRKVPREEFWRIDYEAAAAFARGCRSAGVEHISLLTSVGADATSSNYYLQVKGKVEAAFAGLRFARVSLFRPSVLVTRKIRYGVQDRLTQSLFPVLALVLPSRFHQVRVEDLGRAMRANAERPASREGVEVLYYNDFKQLIRDYGSD